MITLYESCQSLKKGMGEERGRLTASQDMLIHTTNVWCKQSFLKIGSQPFFLALSLCSLNTSP